MPFLERCAVSEFRGEYRHSAGAESAAGAAPGICRKNQRPRPRLCWRGSSSQAKTSTTRQRAFCRRSKGSWLQSGGVDHQNTGIIEIDERPHVVWEDANAIVNQFVDDRALAMSATWRSIHADNVSRNLPLVVLVPEEWPRPRWGTSPSIPRRGDEVLGFRVCHDGDQFGVRHDLVPRLL